MERGAWQAADHHGVAKSQTRLSDGTHMWLVLYFYFAMLSWRNGLRWLVDAGQHCWFRPQDGDLGAALISEQRYSWKEHSKVGEQRVVSAATTQSGPLDCPITESGQLVGKLLI